ncbi:MAG: sel1 repeat family protein [Gammaproteobacteria bacterium]|nr:sel1 repeat family protein [Gammaproteobacteria bacterium]
MKKTGCAILLACLLVASSAASAEKQNTLADGQAAFNAGNYILSFSLWSTLATQGDAEAQVFVGLSYDNGWGTQRSAQLARVWYQKAAKKDNTSGQFLLGLHFIQGTGAERAKGLMWLQRAADNGDSAAQEFIKKGEKRGWFKNIKPAATPEQKEPTPQAVALVQQTGQVQSVSDEKYPPGSAAAGP